MWDCLGLDWGNKYFGIAKGSSKTGLVLPLNKEAPAQDIWVILTDLIKGQGIEYIVIGKPTNFKLQTTAIQKEIQAFISDFQDRFPEVEVFWIWERGTSKEADVALSKYTYFKDINKHLTHHLVAANILVEYQSQNLSK